MYIQSKRAFSTVSSLLMKFNRNSHNTFYQLIINLQYNINIKTSNLCKNLYFKKMRFLVIIKKA